MTLSEDEPLLNLLEKPLNEITDPEELDQYVSSLRSVVTDKQKLKKATGRQKPAKKTGVNKAKTKALVDDLLKI